MQENRKIALQVAIDTYLISSILAEEYEKMDIEEFTEKALIWDPFLYHSPSQVCEYIETLADTIQNQLHIKDKK